MTLRDRVPTSEGKEALPRIEKRLLRENEGALGFGCPTRLAVQQPANRKSPLDNARDEIRPSVVPKPASPFV